MMRSYLPYASLFALQIAMHLSDAAAAKTAFLLLACLFAAQAPKFGIFAVLISLPFHGLKIGAIPAPFPAVVLTAAFAGTVIRRVALLRLDAARAREPGSSLANFLSVSLILCLGLINLYRDQSPDRIGHLLLFCIAVSYCFVIYDYMASGRVDTFHLMSVLAIATVLAGVVEVYLGGYVGSARRLAVAGNIRALANTCGFVCVGFAGYLLFASRPWQRPRLGSAQRGKPWLLPLVQLACVGTLLLATLSRGVIVAVLAALVSAGLVLLFRVLHKRARLTGNLFLGAVTLALGAGVFLSGEYGDRLFSRLREFQDGIEVRAELWDAGVGAMTPTQIVFGSGIASYRELASLAGYDMYAHSVFIDTFTSFGLIGLVALGYLLTRNLLAAYAHSDLLSTALLSFLVYSHLTHGAINSVTFLVFLAITCGGVSRLATVQASPCRQLRNRQPQRRRQINRLKTVRGAGGRRQPVSTGTGRPRVNTWKAAPASSLRPGWRPPQSGTLSEVS